MKATLKPHPATEAFPMLSEDELLALAEDITQNGQRIPIMLTSDGKQIVDGRNRQRACEIANIEPRYERLPEGADPIEYIYSTNITRRNMNKGQQALALAMLYPEPGQPGRGIEDPATKQRIIRGFSQDMLIFARHVMRFPDLAIEVRDGGRSLKSAFDEAQQRNGIAQAGTAHMARLRNEAPDLAAKVDDGEILLPEAVTALETRLSQRARDTTELHDRLNNIILGAMLLSGLTDPSLVEELIKTYRSDSEFRTGLNTAGFLLFGADEDTIADFVDGARTFEHLLSPQQK